MVKNGYPVNLVRRKIKNTTDQYQKRNDRPQAVPKKIIFIPLTYYGNETIIVSNKIKAKIEGIFPCSEVIFRLRKGLTISKLFMNKGKGRDPMEMGVVDKLSCNKCEQIYIGQTKSNVKERMKQHKEGLRKSDSSRTADHMLNNQHHVIDFDKPYLAYNIQQSITRSAMNCLFSRPDQGKTSGSRQRGGDTF